MGKKLKRKSGGGGKKKAGGAVVVPGGKRAVGAQDGDSSRPAATQAMSATEVSGGGASLSLSPASPVSEIVVFAVLSGFIVVLALLGVRGGFGCGWKAEIFKLL